MLRPSLRLALVALVALAIGRPALATPPAPVTSVSDVTLVDLDDRAVPLSSYAGKVLVMLVADRDSAEENRALKDRLGELSQKHRDRVAVVALADVSVWNFWPAKKYVKAALKEVRDTGATVLCDWKGVLKRRFALRAKQSTLAVVTPDGTLERLRHGPMSPAEAAATVAAIERLIHAAAHVEAAR